VAIDFSLVTQIDSTALSQILSFQKRLRKKGGRFAIIGPNEYIKDMFNLVCFDMAVPTYETREQFEQSETA
ncbi:MAG: STAS domain-containing protein, partial [Chitinispirillaceae bacterium]|jgi:anti-anti-sigma factor|nr:STAS domain-containing protein [Chitinispirillaceae bacterium]